MVSVMWRKPVLAYAVSVIVDGFGDGDGESVKSVNSRVEFCLSPETSASLSFVY